MLTSRALVAGVLLLPLVGCGKKDMTDDTDMAQPPAADLSVSRDLTGPAPDLTRPPEDLSPTDKPMLTGLPMCNAVVVTADELFEKSYKPSCSNGGRCHGMITDAKAMSSWWVGKAAQGTTAVPLVKPGDIHQSYVMYKLLGQHTNPLINGKGDMMPKMGAKLGDSDLCNFINWIKGGAG